MFQGSEIRRNLLGCLEIALFMPQAGTRFGNSYDEMIRSFYIPVFCFPVILFFFYTLMPGELTDESHTVISMIYSLRFAISLGVFLGFVYFLASKIERKDHFYRFVIANNWLSLPTAVILIPLLAMMIGDGHTIQEVKALSIILVFYTYAFTAFMTACVLRVPIELAGFVSFIAFTIDTSSQDLLGWVGSML